MTIDWTSASPAILLGKLLIISFACGVGPNLYLVPARLRGQFIGLALTFALGLGFVMVVAVYCLAFAMPIACVVPITAALSSGILMLGLIRPKDLLSRIREAVRNFAKHAFYLAVAMTISLVCVLPGMRDGGTQPFRIGVDEMGYAITGQYLVDGGGLTSLSREVVEDSGERDLATALANNGKCLDVRINIASEFLLKSIRWYPALTASVLMSIHEPYVYSCQFLILFVPLLLLFGVSQHFLVISGLTGRLAVLGAAAIVLNVNLLNVLCEGQHAQVFAAPFFFLLLAQIIELRRIHRSHVPGLQVGGKGFQWSEMIFTSILGTIVLCSFPELIFLTGIVVILIAFYDAVFIRRFYDRGLVSFSSAVCFGYACAGPYAIAWPMFLIGHLKHLQKAGGFWQPQWASPAEILGIFDMYKPAAADYAGRDVWSFVVVAWMSLLAAEVVALRLILDRKFDRSFWLAPVTFVLVVFIKIYWINRLHNYQYMKSYTLLLVPLVALFLGSLHRLGPRPAWGRSVTGIASVVMIVVGCLYLRCFNEDATYIPASRARIGELRSRVDWREYVWVSTAGGIDKLAYASMVHFNWINLGWEYPFIAKHLDKRLGIWCDRDYADLHSVRANLPVLYQDECIVLFDAGLSLRESGIVSPISGNSDESTAHSIGSASHAFLQARGFK